MGLLPTVLIVHPANPDDYIIINESDFDPAVHRRFEGEIPTPVAVAPVVADEVAATAPAPGSLRTDGPTLEEFVAAGYLADHYPPDGYAAVPSPLLDAYMAGTWPEPTSTAPEAVSAASAPSASTPSPEPSGEPTTPNPANPGPVPAPSAGKSRKR